MAAACKSWLRTLKTHRRGSMPCDCSRSRYNMSYIDTVSIAAASDLRSFPVYVPAEDSQRGFHLRRTASRRGDQIPSPGTCRNKSGRIFASGVVLDSATEGVMRNFDFLFLLHSRLFVFALSCSQKYPVIPSLVCCRSELRFCRLCSY